MLTGCPTMVVKVASKPPVNQRVQGNKMLEKRSSQISSLMSPSNNQGSKSFGIWKMNFPRCMDKGMVFPCSVSCQATLQHLKFEACTKTSSKLFRVVDRLVGSFRGERLSFSILASAEKLTVPMTGTPRAPEKDYKVPKTSTKKETSIVWALPKHCISG